MRKMLGACTATFFESIGGYGILTPGASTVVPLSRKTASCFHGEGERITGAVLRKDSLRQLMRQ